MGSQTDARRMSVVEVVKNRDIATTQQQPGDKKISDEILYYDNDDNKINLAIIFNHSTYITSNPKKLKRRQGTQRDLNCMEDNLNALNFTVRIYNDPKVSEIKEIVNTVSNLNRQVVNCVLFVVMTYGAEGNVLWAHDGYYSTESLTQPFIREDSMLGGIPKLFFIQACRGKKYNHGSESDGTNVGRTIAMAADILVVHSTLEDCVSWREKTGSWFIQTLAVKLLEGVNLDVDILHILTLVNYRITNDCVVHTHKSSSPVKQIPEFRSTLTKCLKFSKFKEEPAAKRKLIASLPEILYQSPIIETSKITYQSAMTSFRGFFNKFLPQRSSTTSNTLKKLHPKLSEKDSNKSNIVTPRPCSSSSSDSVILKSNVEKDSDTLNLPSTSNTAMASTIQQPTRVTVKKEEEDYPANLPSQALPNMETKMNAQPSTSLRSTSPLQPTIEVAPKPHRGVPFSSKEKSIEKKEDEKTAVSTFQRASSIFLHDKKHYVNFVKYIENEGIALDSVTNLHNSIQIDFNIEDDYKKATKFFDAQNIPYHSSCLSDLKVIINGIPETISDQELLCELRSLGYPVSKIQRMSKTIDKTPSPLVVIHLKQSNKWKKKILAMSSLFHLQISVQIQNHENTRYDRFGVPSRILSESATFTNYPVRESFQHYTEDIADRYYVNHRDSYQRQNREYINRKSIHQCHHHPPRGRQTRSNNSTLERAHYSQSIVGEQFVQRFET